MTFFLYRFESVLIFILFVCCFFVFCPFHCIVELIFSATLAFSVFIFVSCFQGNYTCIEWCFSQFYAFLCCLCTLLSLFLKEQRVENFSYCVMSVNIAFPFDITTSGIQIFILALIFIYKKNLTIWSHYKWFHINCTQFLMFQIDKCASQRYKGKIAFGYISLLKLMTTM